MHEHNFSVVSNPNGILFNPISISQSLRAIIEGSVLDERFVIEREGLWYSFLHHSSVHASNKKELQQKINATQNTAGECLKKAKCLIITFGSAFIYQHKALQHVVSNCHKQPAAHFDKLFVEPEIIVETYHNLIQELKAYNPDVKILFTVSPVKYLKDGLENNSLSKASLLLAVHRLIKIHPNCFYFPAFELQNDDLRDYRFYKEDLAHPNAQAIDYIWEKFAASVFSEITILINSEISKLNTALQHRKLSHSEGGDKHLRNYIEQQKKKIQHLLPDFKCP